MTRTAPRPPLLDANSSSGSGRRTTVEGRRLSETRNHLAAPKLPPGNDDDWPMAAITTVCFGDARVARLLAAVEITEPIGSARPQAAARSGQVVTLKADVA